ncbi:MAG: leucine-rich repeat domain-containing protein [Spirochaetales bacterium]|nr:leucine-rich repeat domain-containing protein [Spirochaetales bacterium]
MKKIWLSLIIITSVIIIMASCTPDSPSSTYSVTYLGVDGGVITTHVVKEGKNDVPPSEGELPVNEEFYWSLTEDGDIFDFSTPITEDIVLYPISKTKRVNVDFFYYEDAKPITSKLCKTGSKVSVSDLGFDDKIYSAKFYEIETDKEFNSSLSYSEEGYKLTCKIYSDKLSISEDCAVKGTDSLRARKGSYTLSIPRYLNETKVKAIDNEAFSAKEGEKSYSFTKLILPDTLTSIGEKAFMNCKELVEVTLPHGVSVLSDSIFEGCISLKMFSCNNEVASIGKNAFKDCSNLASVTLSNNLKSIGDYAFTSCISLPKIFIPSSVSSIGEDAFYDCRIMKEIIIDGDLLSLPGAAWGGNEMYYTDKGARGCKDYHFSIKNLEGEELYSN